MRIARVLLVIVAVVCLGVALSYPIRYRMAQEKNDTELDQLAQMRQSVRQELIEASKDEARALGLVGPQSTVAPAPGREDGSNGDGAARSGESPSNASAADGSESPGASNPESPSDGGGAAAPEGPSEGGGEADAPRSPSAASDGAETRESGDASERIEGGDDGYVIPPQPAASAPEPTPEPTLEPNYWDLGKYYAATPSPSPTPKVVEAAEGPTVAPSPTPDRSIRKGPLPYALKEKVVLDKAAILPELREIYALNNDLVGWINIPDTVIDYPVVQAEDGDYYLSHDFFGEENINGQIILDVLCDPYTPSYNLVVSGHHMKNGSMFGGLPEYRNQKYWEAHKFLELDTLMERKHYILFACFYSADYDEDETGFRYNAIIDYKMDADHWLEEIAENQLYDTGIEREFGDEFITLTTCDRTRHHDGRFVVVGRRIREGETFE